MPATIEPAASELDLGDFAGLIPPDAGSSDSEVGDFAHLVPKLQGPAASEPDTYGDFASLIPASPTPHSDAAASPAANGTSPAEDHHEQFGIFADLVPPSLAPESEKAISQPTSMDVLKDRPEGMLHPGNLDPFNRKPLQNPDGSYSTTSSISIGTDQGEVLIPTVVDGKRLTNEEAIQLYKTTGDNLGVFDTPQNADAFAQRLHEAQAKAVSETGTVADSYQPHFPHSLAEAGINVAAGLSDLGDKIKAISDYVAPGFYEQATSGPFPVERSVPEKGDSQLVAAGKAVRNTVNDFVNGVASPALLATGLGGALGVGEQAIKGGFAAYMTAHLPELWNRVQEAEKTPPGSQERWEAGLGMTSTIAFIHGLAKGAATSERAVESPDAPIPASSGVDPLDQPPFAESDPQSAPVSSDTPAPNAPDVANESSSTPSDGEISPPESGMVRLYHGGAGEVAGSDFTPSLDYAQGYADKAGGQVFHVDVPADASFLRRDEGSGNRLLNRQVVPNEIADQARPLESPATESTSPGNEPVAPESVTTPTEEQARGAGLRDEAPSVPVSSEQAASDSRPDQPGTTSYSLDDIPPEVTKAIPRVAGDAAQKELITGMSERARQSLGPGAASADEFPLIRAENAREYATIGAAHLLEGKSDKASWVSAMQEEYGARDASPQELNKIWRDSHDLLHDFRAAQTGTPLRPKAQIEQTTGIRPGLAIVKGQLSDAVTRAEALSGYLQGMEKGSKLGAAARQKQLSIADKWLAADQEKVRRTLTEFVSKTLPPSERGRFTGAVTRALRRPDLVRGDPASMYRNAFRVMQAIENRSEDVHRGNLIGEIKKMSARILDSPSVDLAAKRILQRTLSEINLRTPQKSTVQSLGKTREFLDRMAAAGKDVLMPQKVLANLEQLEKRPIKELPTTTLEDLHTKVRVAEKIGRMRVKTRGAQWEAEKKMRLGEIQAGDGSPLAMRELFRPQPGERLSLGERVRNWTARRLNYATAFDLGHLPVDVHFDLLQGGKGTYSGPLFDHIRNPIDAAYDRAQSRAMQELEPLREIIKRNKLSDVDEDLIGLWAQLQQEGGEARAMESGVTKATIDKLKGSGLTKAQTEAYDYMRGRLDATLPEVQSVMHELFNIDVEAVEHYFPWMRDWESYKPSADRPVFDARTGQEVSPEMLDSFGKLAGDYAMRDTAKLQRGFTIDRVEGAKTPIRTDSFDVFQRHMYSASRLIEMQRDLKMAGEIIRDNAFAKKFGAYGQRMLNQWLTAVATDGRGNNVHRMPLLDMARRGSNRALVFFRLTSNIKHLSAVPQAVVNSGGPEYFFRGLHGLASKEGQAFLKNFPQVTERQAGDMSLQELQRSLGTTPSGLFPKGLALADRYGFVLGKEIDAVNSRAVFLGRYLRNLEDRGIKTGFSGPVDRSAASNALAFMRRTVSSTLAKDVQPVLGRGQGFGGNVSVARTMNAFRQYALERWSLLRYDVPAAFTSGNYTRGVALLAAAVAAGLYETNIAGAIRHAGVALTGPGATAHEEKEHESWLDRLMVDGFSMVPYANNIISAVQWGQSGIPLVDNFVNAGKTAKRVAVAKTNEGKKSAVISATGAAAQLGGVPGSGVATSLAKKVLVDSQTMKREAAQLRRHHHPSAVHHSIVR